MDNSPDFQQYDGDKISGAPFRQNSINVTNRIRDNSKNNFDHMRMNSERKLHSENLEEFRRNNFRLNERLPHKFSLDRASENERNVLERRRSSPLNDHLIEQHANLIVSRLENDPEIMEDTPIGEQKRQQTIREMPQSLTMKRTIKKKLSKQINRQTQTKLGCYKQFKYSLNMFFSKLGSNLRNFLYNFELWYSSLKTIEGNFGASVALYFKFLRWIFLFNTFLSIFTVSFVILPQILYNNNTSGADGSFWDIFTGRGFLVDSILFYGFYSDHSVGLLSTITYRMPSAYFFTALFLYLFAFIILSIRAAKSYRKSFIQSEIGVKHVFANKVFCGWDYNIATEDAAALKSSTIFHELRELIAQALAEKQKLTTKQVFFNYIKYFSVHILVLVLISVVGYLVWLMEQWEDPNTILLISIIINILISGLPILFGFIIKFENYRNPTIAIGITMFRTFVLGFVAIATLLAYILKDIDKIDCWETFLGQHIYLFIIYDWIFGVILTTVFDLAYFCYLKFRRKADMEFDVGRYSLHIIYNQSLLWFGLFFAPLTCLLVIVKLFLIWYLRKFVALKLCIPSRKTYRASQAYTWIQIMVFLSLLLFCGLFGYALAYLPPSSTCGPFRNYNSTLELLTNGVFQLEENNYAFKLILFIRRPGCIALILLLLCAGIYYLRERAHSQLYLVKMYQDMLYWEREDKAYIIKKILGYTNGHWRYNLKDSREIDPVTTLPDAELLNNIVDYNNLGLTGTLPNVSWRINHDYFEMPSTSNRRQSDGYGDELDSRFKKYY